MSRMWLVMCCGVLACAVSAPISGAAQTDAPVTLHNQTWKCTSAQTATVVTVLVDNKEHVDGAHLDAGCTGSIIFHITTNGADGVKIHNGAHDLTLSGDITCIDKKD